jgi:hypothetical protein
VSVLVIMTVTATQTAVLTHHVLSDVLGLSVLTIVLGGVIVSLGGTVAVYVWQLLGERYIFLY